MKIAVLLKQTPDTETRVKIQEGAPKIDETGVNFIINPYDEFALEEALRIREKIGEGEVTIISAGPDRAQESIRTGLAMGADRAIHINDPSLQETDSLGIARALAAAVKTLSCDLVLCGQRSIDMDNVQTGACTAELLGLPQVYLAMKVEIAEDRKSARVHRQVEGGLETVEVALPALITCQKGINEPRYPKLPDIMKAKRKEIKKMTLSDLGLSAEEVAPLVKLTEMFLPPPRKECKMLDGEPKQQVKELVRLLREEAKVI